MSILLVGPERSPGEAIVSLLIEEGDEVRVLTDRKDEVPRWKELRAHVAVGALDDADLIERAAQACRSLVVPATVDLEAVVSAARAATVERVILLASTVEQSSQGERILGGIDHVILKTRKRGPLRRSIAAPDLAAAVSAADDLGGDQRLVADLGEPEGWRALRLEPR